MAVSGASEHIHVLEGQGYYHWELCTPELKIDILMSDPSLGWALGMLQAWW